MRRRDDDRFTTEDHHEGPPPPSDLAIYRALSPLRRADAYFRTQKWAEEFNHKSCGGKIGVPPSADDFHVSMERKNIALKYASFTDHLEQEAKIVRQEQLDRAASAVAEPDHQQRVKDRMQGIRPETTTPKGRR